MNLYKPHVFVLPEDAADQQIVNGFLLTPGLNERAIQVLPPAGGWRVVGERFQRVHAAEMRRYPEQRMVLVVDFDADVARREAVLSYVPADLRERVFVLGAFNEPEDLRRPLGSYETIGKGLGEDCVRGTDSTWGHELLRHNADEVARVRLKLRPILFP